MPPATRPVPDSVIAAGLLAAALALYLPNLDFVLNGDSAIYANFVHNRVFDSLTIHIGYYALVHAVHGLVQPFAAVPLDHLLVYIDVALGAGGIVLAFHLARAYLGDTRHALLAALVLLLCRRYLFNAVSAEVYMLQTFLLLASFVAFLRVRMLLSGALAAASLFVSPLSVFAFLFYPVASVWRRPSRSDLVAFAAPLVLGYGSFVVLFQEELFWGDRGLLKISSALDPDLGEAVVNLARFQVKHYSLLIVPAVVGLFALARHREFAATALAVALPHLYIVSKLRSEDNVFLLPTDPFFCILIAIGLLVVIRAPAGRWLAGALVAGHALLLTVTEPLFDGRDGAGYGTELRTVYRERLEGRDALLITNWTQRIALSYYARDRHRGPLEAGPAYEKSFDEERLDELDPGTLPRELYVLESYAPSGMARLLLGADTLDNRRTQHSLRGRVERGLTVRCTLEAHGYRELWRCE